VAGSRRDRSGPPREGARSGSSPADPAGSQTPKGRKNPGADGGGPSRAGALPGLFDTPERKENPATSPSSISPAGAEPRAGSAPAPGSRTRPLTVAELNRSVQREIEDAHPAVWIVGEISNLNRYSSGHLYFTLKDRESEISSVMFAGSNRRLRFAPADGSEVLACGRPTVYIPRGRYQFIVEEMEPRGRGSLLEAFEALKQRLRAEGLFEPERKRPIPVLPRRVGVVTSPDGAAIRDILKVLRRRHAGVDVLVSPTRVQGEGAAEEIVAAIERIVRHGGVDVLIVGRGGGSIEDLWAFNEEIVARAIVASPIPVISAVGHETDVTIADFAADVRAATPSQAAEMVVASREELGERLRSLLARLEGASRMTLVRARRSFELLDRRPGLGGFPALIAGHGQDLDDLAARLEDSLRGRLDGWTRLRRELAMRLAPRHLLEVVRRRRDGAEEIRRRARAAIAALVRERRARLESVASLLRSLSPLNVLDRGYAICLDPARGSVVRSSDDVSAGDGVEVRLARGALDCRVTRTHPPRSDRS
jgi:exodeoxyribonuclease VII large subunit